MPHLYHNFFKIPGYKRVAWPVLVFSCLSLILILIFQNDNVSTFPIGWDKTFQVTPFDINIKNIRLSRKGNIIALAYEGEKNKSFGIYVSISFNGGEKFLQPVKIAPISSKTDINPDISVSINGHIAVAWQELTEDDPDSHIYYSTSVDMGATWSDPVRFVSPTEMELLPKILYDERGTMHIFYNAYKDKGFSLFHTISGDEKKFTEPVSIVSVSPGLRGAFFPAIHSTNSYIYLVWQGKEKIKDTLSDYLYFIKSTDYGKSWTSKRLITESKGKDSTPFILTVNKDIYLVYQNDETKNWGIRLIRGKDRGNVWEEPVIVSTTNADCYSPSAVLSEDENLFVIWYDMRNKIPGVFVKKMSLQNQNQIPEVMLSRSNVSARKPLAISLGRKIMVFWEESGRLMAKNSDVYVEPPILYSQTHPENTWSKSSTAIIKWQPQGDESNITGYAYFLKNAADSDQETDPAIANINGNVTEFRTPELEDGISYFYIRAIDGAGNYSRTVRYKIMVSKNPPSMPIVKSTTHPDGKPMDSINATIDWTMQDPTRIKGYLYSIAKDTIKKPDIFTTDKEVKFDNLSEGRHFFAIQAIDKTNMVSRIATYQIIVGRAENLDPEVYRRIALGNIETAPETEIKQVEQIIKVKMPSLELLMPFDITKAYDKPSFDIALKPKDIEEKNIIGYSYLIGKEEKLPADRINSKTKSISISDLKDGEYYISAKGMYYQYKNNVKDFKWTEPVIKRFTINTVQESPDVVYLRNIIGRLAVDYTAVSVSLAAMLLSILTIGFGSRLSFYMKLIHLKFSNIFRIF